VESLPTVLFVDDEPEVTQALRAAMRREPFRILVADSAKGALEVMAREHVDVVVTDESMPGTRGSQLLAAARRDHPHVITMVLTGHWQHEDKIRDLAEGNVHRFFRKPCDPQDLAAGIHEALRERHSGKDDELRKLEREHPGITDLEMDDDGTFVIE
jgi:DNA-binding NtrC family response regulator